MASLDWSQTPIGPVEEWPQSLRTAVGICLESRFPILVWWGPELALIYNDGYREMLGDKHPASMGQPGRQVWGEIWDVIGPMLDGVVHDGAATWSEDQLLLMDRHGYPEEAYFTFSYGPIREGGKVGGIFTAVSETTQRVINERRLRLVRRLSEASSEARTEEQLFAAFAAALRGESADLPFAHLYLVDGPGGRARLALSAGGVALEGIAVDLGAGGPTAEVLAEAVARGTSVEVADLSGRWEPALALSDDERQPSSAALALPVRARATDDALGVLIAGLNPLRPLDDGYRGFLDLVTQTLAAGIADARAFEEERRRAEALEALSNAKSAFFNNVSHEFRTPLTLLLGPIDDALADTSEPLSPAHRERLETAQRNVLRLRRLVNSLLEFSRTEDGGTRAKWQVVDLARLTAELAAAFDTAITGAGLVLRVDCPPLPQPVVVDPEQWERLVLNLISNALKHTWEGEVAVELRDDAGEVVLTVRDTGTGIPGEELPRLFERFHRVQGAGGRSHEGTGIGLAIVAEVAAAHDGQVTVDSTLGAGSAFEVRLPYGHERVRPEQLAAPVEPEPMLAGEYLADTLAWAAESDIEAPLHGSAAGATDGAQADRPRIVLADDNADMRAYVTRLLSAHYEVEPVGDGATALDRVLANPPDLLLTDVMMPGLDGIALLERLRADERTARLPIVLLSARAGSEASVDALDAGADDYLVKPFSALELVARVRANLEMGRLREQATMQAEAAYVREHALVEELQRSLLPARLPDLPDIDVASCYLPASPEDAVGGDWYDLVRLPDERVMVVVGDVVGHGLRAASTMSHLRTATRAYAAESHSPNGVVDRVSSLVERTGVGLGSTMLLAFVDTLTGSITYASAGHPPALVATPGDGARWLEHGLGPPLGLASASPCRAVEDRLDPGETLVLYTDGLVERRDADLGDQLDRLASATGADGGPEALIDRLVQALGVADHRDDDVALIAVEHVPALQRLQLDLGTAADLGEARRSLRGWLLQAGADEDTSDEVVLAVSEALINAVEHAGLGDDAQISVRGGAYGDRLRIVVRDNGRWQRQGPAHARGHGLRIIRALMDDVELDTSAHGTRLELHRELVRR